jgi:hypothetical protein
VPATSSATISRATNTRSRDDISAVLGSCWVEIEV